MSIKFRIALSAILALALCISACGNEQDADDESHRASRGIGTSPSVNAVQDAGPDAQVK